MKINHPCRQRQGSIIITLLGGLVFVVIFFGMYCYKQLQANRQGARSRAAQQAHKLAKNHHWSSPDSDLAFKRPPDFSLRRKTFKLANQRTGRVVFESDVEGEIVRCKWRADSKACAVEYKPIDGKNDVVLWLIEGDRVTECRPAEVIDPNQFLPVGDQQLESQWEHTVKVGDFRGNGDLLIQWIGLATMKRPGKPDRVTRIACHFIVRYTSAGDLVLVESLPQGKPKSKDVPDASVPAKVVIPRGIRLRPPRPDSLRDAD